MSIALVSRGQSNVGEGKTPNPQRGSSAFAEPPRARGGYFPLQTVCPPLSHPASSIQPASQQQRLQRTAATGRSPVRCCARVASLPSDIRSVSYRYGVGDSARSVPRWSESPRREQPGFNTIVVEGAFSTSASASASAPTDTRGQEDCGSDYGSTR